MSINSVVNDTVTGESVVNALKPKPPTITGYTISGADDTALDPAGGQTILLNGTGFQRGATVTLNGTAISVVTYVNANQLSFTSPAVSAGTYTIYAVNADGGTGIYIPGLIYSNLPTWTTAAGTLGSYYETQAVSNTVVAAGDAPVTYSLFSGALPTGAVFNANGVITGTAPADSGSTTYSFTIQATDAQLQDSTRSFSLTINTDVVSWTTPNANATYTSVAGTAIANVSLLATSAAGSAVAYSANALPTGVALSGNIISGTPSVVGSSSTLLTATATATTRSATRTINWTINVAADTYFKNTTLLLPGAGTTFVADASTNNFAITVNGDTKPNSFNPYTPGYYSNYFDGSGDYLSAATNSAFDITGDFTIEAWVYFTADPTANQDGNKVATISGYSDGTTANKGWEFSVDFTNNLFAMASWGTGNLAKCSFTPQKNVWYHFSATKQSSTTSLFINGVSQTLTTNTLTINAAAASSVLNCGRASSSSGGVLNYFHYLSGYISNFRIVKGTAVYTSNFTPSTTPLTAIANTSLLTCQSNRFIDNSTNNFTLTVAGNTSISSFDPFVPNSSYSTYGSAYSDGNGDYIAVADNSNLAFGTGDYTIEMWVYLISYAQSSFWESNPFGTTGQRPNGFIWYQASGVVYVFFNGSNFLISSANVIPLAQWAHIALVRNSGATAFYVNGVNVAAASTTYNSTNGAGIVGAFCDGGTYSINGYISNLRAVKGTAVYTSNFTPPSAPLTAIANTSLLTLQNNQSVNNNVFLDNSTNNFFVTRNGNTTQGTFSPYGGNWSNYFDGTGDYLSATGTALDASTTTDYTVEFWMYTAKTASAQMIYELGTGVTNDLQIYVSTTALVFQVDGNSPSATVSFSDNTWVHVACVKSNTTLTTYINGVGTTVDTGVTVTSKTTAYIGMRAGASLPFTGYLSNMRVTRAAVYTANFTPSTTPLTPTTTTSLLICQSNRLIDNSINNFAITRNGDVGVQQFSPFNPASVTPASYGAYFDGTGDYLTIPYSTTAFDWWTNDYTIEAWVYASSWSSWSVSPSTQPGLIGNYTEAENINYWCFGPTADGTVKFYYWNGAQNHVTSTATVSVNQWNHIAVTKTSSGIRLWVNGVGNTATAISGTPQSSESYSLVIGKTYTATGITGSVSNLRIIKYTAVYTSNFTPSTIPLTAIVNTQLLTLQSSSFVDNSGNNRAITSIGDTKPTQLNPFGITSTLTDGYTLSTVGGSAYFGGSSSDYLSIPGSVFAPTGDFSIMFWCYVMPSATGYMHALGNYTANTSTDWMFEFNFNPNGSMYVYNSGGATQVGTTGTIRKGEWTHVAMIRSGTTVTAYLNGVSLGTRTQSGTFGTTSKTIYIGGLSAQGDWNGYITDVCLVNGTALYTSNFVPPSAPQTAVRNTSLLLNMTNAGIYDAATQNLLQTVGDAKLSTAVTKFGSTSMSFDGTGDYLTIPSSANLQFGTADFTVECWAYFNSLSSIPMIWHKNSANSGWFFEAGTNTLYFGYASASAGQYYQLTGITLTTSIWYHLAVTRVGTTLSIFLNGIKYSSTVSGAGASADNSAPFIIGSFQPNNSNYDLNGYIDDFRITRGYARYTANFTPPTEAFMTK